MFNLKIPTLALAATLTACTLYPEIEYYRSGDALVLEGVIDGETRYILEDGLRENPGIRQLVLLYVPGSADDERSLADLSRFVRASGLATVVPADGVVASGGTDMVVMGRTRIIKPGACVGVHTWGGESFGGMVSGAELPRSDPRHQLYLRFYREMGIPEDFYWFTLAVAGLEDIHWMTENEINRFGLSTVPLRGSPAETTWQRNNRCYGRLDGEEY